MNLKFAPVPHRRRERSRLFNGYQWYILTGWWPKVGSIHEDDTLYWRITHYSVVDKQWCATTRRGVNKIMITI